MNVPTVAIRLAAADEMDAVVSVCAVALGWSSGGVDGSFFTWKHIQNPFGSSPIWVAEDKGAIVGVRAMMRWRLTRADGSTLVTARAVDTATLPSHQGQGIFSRLTTTAIDQLTADGVDAIFNTPNDKSRPGYLKLGWETLGRAPVRFRPRSLASLPAIAQSRTSAEKWGEEVEAGLAPSDALSDGAGLRQAIERSPVPEGWSTPLSADYLRWRAGFPALGCRIEPVGDRLADGFLVFRVRRRGEIRQLSVLHIVGPTQNRAVRATLGRLMAQTGCDVALVGGDRVGLAAGLCRLPRGGPIVTWRGAADVAERSLDDLCLDLGTIESF